jgi:cytochrome c peroxidase
MVNAVLVDSGPLYALADPSDQYHQRASEEYALLQRQGLELVVSYSAMLEAYSLIQRNLGLKLAQQWLQELVFEDDPWEDREALRRLAVRLEVAAHRLVDAVKSVPVEDRMLFEPMQSLVIRVMTQGITGFDSPATQFSLPESHISLEAIRPVLDPYLPALRARDRDIAARLEAAYDDALRMLRENPGFDDFDRLAFIREAGNPLYAALIDAHHALNIATIDDSGI